MSKGDEDILSSDDIAALRHISEKDLSFSDKAERIIKYLNDGGRDD